MKKFTTLIIMLLLSVTTVCGSTDIYTVQKGDSLWTIAKKYQVGISEIIDANKQFSDPNLIYPGQKAYIPLPDPVTKGMAEEVVALVNKERQSRGLAPLKINWEVARVAQYKSQDMADRNYFNHTSPTYGTPFEMLKKFNVKYSTAGENIAKGQKSAQAVMNSWMNSEGHRNNILSKSFTEIGVGYATGNNTVYWTQMFIKP